MNLFKYPTHCALVGCLFLASASVVAGPIVFTNSEYTAFALAELGPETDGPFALSSPPGTLPLIASANLFDVTDSSFATGITNTGLLVASTQAFSLGTSASGVSGAGFSGQFIGTGEQVDFAIDFSTFNNVINGIANAQLFVTLVSNGTALFDEVFVTSQLVQQSFILSTGSTNLFDIQLISNADALVDVGDPALGFNLASAAFTVSAVPEPGMAWLMLAGMGLLGLTRRKWRV